jgi:dolichol-phosphate mannosyltransferase
MTAFAVAQGLLGARVLTRMLRTAAGDPIAVTAVPPASAGSMSIVVPVLDEEARLGPCLEGLLAQGPWVREILVVDGGSRDRTLDLVASFARRDPRVRAIDASPVPEGWNGKAWGLAAGLARSAPSSTWIATIDADVRPRPQLTASLLAHAVHGALDAFSAAPLLVLSSDAEAIVHPAMLATLVYRFGLPGNVALNARDVQANGQCFLAKRALLVATDAFAAARTSRCDDVTIARRLVEAHATVGFFEGSQLASVAMYASARECWQNWPRSLPMRDASTQPLDLALALAEVALVQALPLALCAALLATGRQSSLLFRVNAILAVVRLATLAGTRRAYAKAPPSYWLSPLADLPVAAELIRATFARSASWRGRALVAEGADA